MAAPVGRSMAGGVLKGFGITLLILGILLLVAGLVAAAAGAYLYKENDDRFVGDPDQEELAADTLIGGGLSFTAGLVLLIVGLVLNSAGNARRHRELLQAVAAKPAATGQAGPAAPAAAPPGSGNPKAGWTAAGVLVAFLLAGIAAVAAFGGGSGPGRGLLSGEPAPLPSLDVDGAVRQAIRLPLAGATTTDSGGSLQEFQAPDGARSLLLGLNWTPVDGGSDELLVIVEADEGNWTEVGRASGPGPLTLDAPLDGALHLRYRVFPGGDSAAVAEQPFHVHIDFAR